MIATRPQSSPTAQPIGPLLMASWQDPIHMPPLMMRDSERRDYCAPSWLDQVAAILGMQEAIRAAKRGHSADWYD